MPMQESIEKFIRKDLASGKGEARIDPDHNLIETGVIDSLGIQKLIVFLESNFAIEILDDELLPENFETIDAISSFVDRKVNGL